jgi:hypothetical protein
MRNIPTVEFLHFMKPDEAIVVFGAPERLVEFGARTFLVLSYQK